MLMLVVATRRNHEQPAFKGQKVVKKLHIMWNWDDIKKRLASGRVGATSEQHRFKLNRCECDFTDLKKDAIIYYSCFLRKLNFGLSNLVNAMKHTVTRAMFLDLGSTIHGKILWIFNRALGTLEKVGALVGLQ